MKTADHITIFFYSFMTFIQVNLFDLNLVLNIYGTCFTLRKAESFDCYRSGCIALYCAHIAYRKYQVASGHLRKSFLFFFGGVSEDPVYFPPPPPHLIEAKGKCSRLKVNVLLVQLLSCLQSCRSINRLLLIFCCCTPHYNEYSIVKWSQL